MQPTNSVIYMASSAALQVVTQVYSFNSTSVSTNGVSSSFSYTSLSPLPCFCNAVWLESATTATIAMWDANVTGGYSTSSNASSQSFTTWGTTVSNLLFSGTLASNNSSALLGLPYRHGLVANISGGPAVFGCWQNQTPYK